jgi:hypothetical protein
MKRKLLLVAVPLVSFTLFSFVFRVQGAPVCVRTSIGLYRRATLP